VPGDVSLVPVALAVCLVETASNNEVADVVASVARNHVITESQHEIHPMFARAAAVIVKTSPRPGREIHSDSTCPSFGIVNL
jgi:hypothetical protein